MIKHDQHQYAATFILKGNHVYIQLQSTKFRR